MISNVIYTIVHAYTAIIFIYCVLSWFPGSRSGGILGDVYGILSKIVDPYLNLFRKLIPPIGGTIDISPIIGMLVLEGVARLLLSLIF